MDEFLKKYTEQLNIYIDNIDELYIKAYFVQNEIIESDFSENIKIDFLKAIKKEVEIIKFCQFNNQDDMKILIEHIRLIPSVSGIYKFYNENDEVIYIGKSVDLSRRIKTHIDNKIKKEIACFYKSVGLYFLDENLIDDIEKILIKKYKPINNFDFNDEVITEVNENLITNQKININGEYYFTCKKNPKLSDNISKKEIISIISDSRNQKKMNWQDFVFVCTSNGLNKNDIEKMLNKILAKSMFFL